MKKEDIKPEMEVYLTDNSYSVDITSDGKPARNSHWAGTNWQPRIKCKVLFISDTPLPTAYMGFVPSRVSRNNIALINDNGDIRFTRTEYVEAYTNEKQLIERVGRSSDMYYL